jgi:hypothetical protein
MMSAISGSHGGEHEDGCLLDCCAVQSGRSLSTFKMRLLPPLSGRLVLIMGAASTSETSANFYQTTPRNNPEDGHLLVVTSH